MDSNGTIQTVAGNGSQTFSGDGGSATAAGIPFPGSVVVDPAGNLFVVDGVDNRVREVAGSTINTIAGTGAAAYGGDNGPPLQAMLNSPFGITLDASGNLYVADSSNNRRKIRRAPAAAGRSSVAQADQRSELSNRYRARRIVTIFGSNLGAAADSADRGAARSSWLGGGP